MMRLALTLLTVFCAVANATPREDVEGIARAIEANFFDPDRAKTIAADLRNSAKAGDFDQLTRADLAVELTERLRKLDGHFGVRLAPPEAPRQRAAPRLAPFGESRTNFGFKSVTRLPGNIGYLELAYAAGIDFSRKDDPARRAADAALTMLHEADAVIIDVRNNGGGDPSMVGYLVSAFVDAQADVYNTFHSREGTASERPTSAYATPMLSVPLYVLTSGRTGSAAESLAFTLQSAKRAQIVGERSAGAANPGGAFRTPEGYEVFVATGSPRNPLNGRNWEGEGVKPDVEAVAARALSRAQQLALEKILRGAISGVARADAQWTLEALRAADQPFSPAQDIGGSFGPYTLSTEKGVLLTSRARWPAMTLLPLRKDLYYFEDTPSRRVALHRDGEKVVAISILNADGSEQRLTKRP
jgi:hypothetical protein